MVMRWLHLDERGGDPWVLPIWTAVNKAIASKRVTRITSEMSELAVHISARLNVLPRVIVRLNSEETSLLAAVKESYGPKHAYTIRGEGTTIVVDNNLKYKLIADIDSLLFEVNSCNDLMRTFFGLLHNHAGRPISPDNLTRTLRDALAKQGVSGGWFKLLDRHRHRLPRSLSHRRLPIRAQRSLATGMTWPNLGIDFSLEVNRIAGLRQGHRAFHWQEASLPAHRRCTETLLSVFAPEPVAVNLTI